MDNKTLDQDTQEFLDSLNTQEFLLKHGPLANSVVILPIGTSNTLPLECKGQVGKYVACYILTASTFHKNKQIKKLIPNTLFWEPKL
jgi:hypothetical protein